MYYVYTLVHFAKKGAVALHGPPGKYVSLLYMVLIGASPDVLHDGGESFADDGPKMRKFIIDSWVKSVQGCKKKTLLKRPTIQGRNLPVGSVRWNFRQFPLQFCRCLCFYERLRRIPHIDRGKGNEVLLV